jgi:hypothetical protein
MHRPDKTGRGTTGSVGSIPARPVCKRTPFCDAGTPANAAGYAPGDRGRDRRRVATSHSGSARNESGDAGQAYPWPGIGARNLER